MQHYQVSDKGRSLTISSRGFVAELHKPGVVFLDRYTWCIVPALPGKKQLLIAPGGGHDFCKLCKMKRNTLSVMKADYNTRDVEWWDDFMLAQQAKTTAHTFPKITLLQELFNTSMFEIGQWGDEKVSVEDHARYST